MASGPEARRADLVRAAESRTAFRAVPLLGFAALCLYVWSAAPGLTWAHHGADGGDLLAAAVVNGVPHPPGYPIYTLLLQGWLAAGSWLASLLGASVPVARLGNLFSASCAALTVAVTGHAAHSLSGARWAAALAAALWAISPLFWGQALITEVYALHMLAVALLGWAMMADAVRPRRVALTVASIVALGAANHLTFLLLLPAAAYALWRRGAGPRVLASAFAVGMVLAALCYLRIPLAAAGGSDGPPPVNWGYADNPAGLWWLISGEAYRGYLFGLPRHELPLRVAAWARTLVEQFTPVGLAVALLGLAYLDRARPVWRTVGLLWTLPVSLYAISYNTADSDIYLLPVVWIAALWVAVGLTTLAAWMARIGMEGRTALVALVGVLALAIVAVAAWRFPQLSLRGDGAAQEYLASVAASVEPGSVIVTVRDGDTFALWYGAWAAGEPEPLPSARLVNVSLLEYAWYRRLLRDLYPDLAGDGLSFAEVIEANRGRVPIYLSEPMPPLGADDLEAVGPLWRVVE